MRRDRRERRSDGDQRARRTTGRAIDARRRRSPRPARTTRSGRTRPTRPSGSRSGRPGIAARRSTARSTRRTSRPRPRRSAATATGQGTDGPLFIGRDTHALSGPAFETALEVLAAHGVDIRVDAADGYTPTPVISHAILVHNRGRRERPGRRDRRHAVAQPARGWRLQVQPAQRRPGRHRRHELDPGRGEPAARSGPRRRPAGPARRRPARRTTAHDYLDELRRRPRRGHRHGRHPRLRAPARRRPARRRERRLLAGHRASATAST